MSIFDRLRHRHSVHNDGEALSLPVNGPQYLRPYLTTPDKDFEAIISQYEGPGFWFGQLVMPDRTKIFELHYDGWLDEGKTRIERATDGVLKLVGIPYHDRQEILIFDRALHGWEGYVKNEFREQRFYNPRAIHPYPSSSNPGLYRVLLVIRYSEKAIKELLEAAVEGTVTLGDASVVSLQEAFDNGFDHISVYVLDENAQFTEVISQEQR